ncbi:VCBS repeat-containing protein [Altibacter sp. HG106]|uniref:VCBS repeat-containing protein n=1 Tax=Altibacter sp. HG106 TaxID=3023937 RepID=UPI002350D79D|nr:VCBS repeat-containing protein [Altibacter sp. HG106]MDC7995979.1 VCBS repeat-containing protein [Altibacter sp. HG106]
MNQTNTPQLLPLVRIVFLSAILILPVSCKDTVAETKKVATSNDATQDFSKGLFQKLPVSQTNIDFANNLQEDVSTMENLFDFDYFYNGSGVGLADLNNDGLQEVFFTGNQVPNKLYLNKGDFVFEDISESAGINVNKQWANGVTFADVNNDGFLDIYVSQGGPRQAADRPNLLYINQGDLTFKEAATDYGLADTGISTQSVFFDMDKDGDLDCFVSNENEFYGLDPMVFYESMKLSDNLARSSGHLYENQKGTFVDISKKAGVMQASFGLGVTVSDINNDGWPDIYVANDYYAPDALFINNGDKTFRNETKSYLNQVSFFGMGVDIADINNDKLQDIFVLDMASTDHIRSKTLMASMDADRFSLLVDEMEMPHQYMYNSLQLNMGNQKFHNISHLSQVAKTDWSWAGLLADLDLDGYKDIYITNGYRRYGSDNDSRNMIRSMKKTYRGNVPKEIKERLYNSLPSEKLSNVFYHNNAFQEFEDATATFGLLEPSFSNGAAYGDLDNDGDLDLVVNNIDEAAFVYKNQATERGANFLKVKTQGMASEPFAKVEVIANGVSQLIETKRVKGYLSATDNAAIFGLGTETVADTVRIIWPSGKYQEKYQVAANATVSFEESEATLTYVAPAAPKALFKEASSTFGLDFAHSENEYNDFEKEILLPYKQSTLGPFIAKGDANGDGYDDLFVGGAANQGGMLYLQTKEGFIPANNTAFKRDAAHEDMESVFFDYDGDGDQDLYVVSGGNEFEDGDARYQDRLYSNDGSGNFSRVQDATIASKSYSGKTVAATDFDHDGDLDLIVGNRIQPQHYPQHAPSYILRNEGGRFTILTDEVAPQFSDVAMINKVLVTDFNNDGWEDFITVGEWSAIRMFQNNQGTFTNIAPQNGLDKKKGLWYTIAETDINRDGQPDYILGNVGKNLRVKASVEQPFSIFGNDFDDNGTYDIVLSGHYKGKQVPFRGRQCSSQQMPFIKDKFETYNEFAHASLEDIYGSKLEEAYHGEINGLESLVLINRGKGAFDVKKLPRLAQKSAVLGIVTTDVNNDGWQDIVITGNIYNTEVETPRIDMGTGQVLLNNGNEDYEVVPQKRSGLYISGDTKSLIMLSNTMMEKQLLVSGRNDMPLSVIEFNQ